MLSTYIGAVFSWYTPWIIYSSNDIDCATGCIRKGHNMQITPYSF